MPPYKDPNRQRESVKKLARKWRKKMIRRHMLIDIILSCIESGLGGKKETSLKIYVGKDYILKEKHPFFSAHVFGEGLLKVSPELRSALGFPREINLEDYEVVMVNITWPKKKEMQEAKVKVMKGS